MAVKPRRWLVLLASLFTCVLTKRVILTSVNVYALKTRATYSCSAAHAIGARWYLNGTDSRELNLTNTTDVFFSETNVGIFLFLYLTGEYNNTHIQCEAFFSTEPPERSGNNKTLMIQGYLSSVGSLNYSLTENNLTLTWEAPFSLDIPRISVDVEYCIDIVSSGKHLHSECDVQDTYYDYHYHDSFNPCANNTAIIIPVNIVGNGTASFLLIDSEEEPVCTEDPTTVTTVQVSSTSISKNYSLPTTESAIPENLVFTSLTSSPTTYIVIIASVVGVLVALGGTIIIIIIILVCLCFMKFRTVKKISEEKSKYLNEHYDNVSDGDKHIYEEIKGKPSKSSQFTLESNTAYASHSRLTSNKVKDCSTADKDTTLRDPDTHATEIGSHYEKIVGDRSSNNSNSSNISVMECPAYITITTH